MTTYYYNTERKKQRPRSIITSFSPESWDLSMETTPPPPPSSVVGRRPSSQNVPYFSLFSTPTWQTTAFHHQEEQKSPPIDFDFLNNEKDYFHLSAPWTYQPQHPPQQQRPLLTPPPQSPTRQKIDDYFSPPMDVNGLGKGVFLNQVKESQRIYQVGFKNKHEYFYTDDKFKVNDKVVVEADRGYDIGLVLGEEIAGRKKKKLPQQNENSMIKRIFRLANAAELITLEKKKVDEEKALSLCQAKIKQKGLHMQVVSAEYQWDRRKLTFYWMTSKMQNRI
ncbi:PSP1 C-terminal conserved region-domain-containing protein, partial [Mucor mucedo]|uniref:PSP1 C-terminal conserved region-domain-containing protein n=1 Tax=Mucor mucedo TaxID=29922 RepID=UPI00221F9127